MAIVRESFAKECVRQGLYCGVHAHYLIGVGQLRSGIDDGRDGERIGPFRLTQAEWDANRTDAEFEFNFEPQDIVDWRSQCAVFALMTARTQDKLIARLGRNPSALELYLEQWPDPNADQVKTDLHKAFDDTAALVGPAVSAVFDDPAQPAPVVTDPAAPPAGPVNGAINLNSIPAARRPIAQLIITEFGNAGFATLQQAAALANAIAESNLNPDAHAGGIEDSWGLFQLNRHGGLGSGHSPDELRDPTKNTRIVIAEARRFPAFASAASITDAVSVFVRKVERPADAPGQIVRRVKIAQQLLA